MDRFVFAHALVRETLYERQSASRRVRLHRRIGEALEAHRRREPGRARLPLLRGAGATKAVDYALAAAEQAAAALAYEEAAEHYRRALVEPRLDILLALGAAELRAGDPRRARRSPPPPSWRASATTARRWPRPRSASPAATPRRA